MELKMATTGTLTSLQFLLNQVAHKLVYKGSTQSFLLFSNDGYRFLLFQLYFSFCWRTRMLYNL